MRNRLGKPKAGEVRYLTPRERRLVDLDSKIQLTTDENGKLGFCRKEPHFKGRSYTEAELRRAATRLEDYWSGEYDEVFKDYRLPDKRRKRW